MTPGRPGDSSAEAFVRYWKEAVPWNYQREGTPYAERRRLRYSLQDYMAGVIPFGSYGGKRVLELGSGAGIDSAEFARNGAEMVSLDFTETGVKRTKETMQEAGVSKFDVVRADAQHLPFRGGVFDCVYSFGVLHHIPEARDVLSQISRILADQGEVVLMLYNKDSLLYSYSILYLHRDSGLSDDQLVSRYSERIEGCPYTRAYTALEARQMLGEAFDHVTTSVHFDAIDTPDKRKVKFSLEGTTDLGWHLVVKGRKKGKPNQERPLSA